MAGKIDNSNKSLKKFKSPLSISKPALLDAGQKSDKKFRQLIYDLSVAGVFLETARNFLASHLGVSSPQYNILMVVAQYQAQNGVSVSEIASHLHVTVAHVGTEAKSLEKKGWLIISPNPEDRRVKLLKINDEAEELISNLGHTLKKVNNALFQHLNKNEFDNLSRILGKLVLDFEKVVKNLKHLEI